MNDSLVNFGTKLDAATKTIAITAFDSAQTKSTLTYQQPSPDRLILDGALGKEQVHMELKFRDPDSFLIRSRGFNWVQEYPFNR
jgi:hypothetical protein